MTRLLDRMIADPTTWRDGTQTVHTIAEMDAAHAERVMDWLLRQAISLQAQFETSTIGAYVNSQSLAFDAEHQASAEAWVRSLDVFQNLKARVARDAPF